MRPVLKTLSKSALCRRRRVLGSKPFSALFATSLDDVLAILGLHARAKSVGFVLVAFVGLVSALHGLDLGMNGPPLYRRAGVGVRIVCKWHPGCGLRSVLLARA